MAYYPKKPIFLHQWETSVAPNFRGSRIGKWLKAELLWYMVERFPEAKILVTGSANSNAAMLSINKRIGFKHYKSEVEYKFTIKDLAKAPSNVIVFEFLEFADKQ